uniref:Arr2 n=1 Tax=Pseudomonas aeruginosa TaxID=287 RepID=A0A1I9WCN4_PSEAI|nr:Arr2 [Pseudomonas aeruginosa]
MPLPVFNNANNSQGFAGSIGLCWITGKFFVRKIRIVFERSCWLNYVYVAATLEARQ